MKKTILGIICFVLALSIVHAVPLSCSLSAMHISYAYDYSLCLMSDHERDQFVSLNYDYYHKFMWDRQENLEKALAVTLSENITNPLIIANGTVAVEGLYMMSEAKDYRDKSTKDLLKGFSENHLLPNGKVNYTSYGDSYEKLKLKSEGTNIIITDKDAVNIISRIDELDAFAVKISKELCLKNKNAYDWCN